MIHVVIFIVSLAVLVKCADWFVEYAARMARRFHVSDLVIGLTLTSVGTSIPELASSVSAALQDHGGLIIGNVVGSNIANIGLILGVAAVLRPFETDRKVHDRDGFILLAVVVVFFLMTLNNHISRWEAIVFLVVYAAYVVFLAKSDSGLSDVRFRRFVDFFVDLEYIKPLVRRRRTPLGEAPPSADSPTPDEPSRKHRELALEALVLAATCAGIVLAARYMVDEAAWFARALDVPESIIGLSLIAVGTSLPELVVAISAARKGTPGLVLGNVVGSNIANILLIIGVSGTLRPLEVLEVSVVTTIPIMLFFTIFLLYSVKTGWRLTRLQGVLAIVSYVSFIALAFLLGWS